MERAKVLHFEDNEFWQQKVAEALESSGHEVVGVANDYPEAEDNLVKLAKGLHAANVVLMNSQLRGGNFMNHPQTIAADIKRKKIDIPVIGLSQRGLALRGLVLGRDMDADILKSDFLLDSDILRAELDELPEPKPHRHNW
ncbi:MAG TPA: hypothetical protein VFH37_03180 [Candidatus Saccharimonadales bacterium]|nr:hypothetical protein [Candidatus Saccharimonadales bacterium]